MRAVGLQEVWDFKEDKCKVLQQGGRTHWDQRDGLGENPTAWLALS